MYVVLAYDIAGNRVGKVMKIVKKYLTARQKSVYEGELTEGRLKMLKRELAAVIDTQKDAVVIYKYTFNAGLLIDEIGVRPRRPDRFL